MILSISTAESSGINISGFITGSAAAGARWTLIGSLVLRTGGESQGPVGQSECG